MLVCSLSALEHDFNSIMMNRSKISEAITKAIASKNLSQVKVLIEKHPDSVFWYYKHELPLSYAIGRKNEEISQYILKQGADPYAIVKGKSCRELAEKAKLTSLLKEIDSKRFKVRPSVEGQALEAFKKYKWSGRTRYISPIAPIGIFVRLLDEHNAYIKDVVFGSPADGKLHLNDQIIGVNGKKITGPSQDKFPRFLIQMAEELEKSQAANGIFELTVIRGGKEKKIQMTVRQQKSFSVNYPFNCQRSDDLYDRACEYIASKQREDGSFDPGREVMYQTSLCALALLGSGDPKYKKNLALAAEFLMTNIEKAERSSFSSWFLSFPALFLAEYNLALGGDKKIYDKLVFIYQALRRSQMSFGGRFGKWYDNGGYHWGHGTAYTDKYGGYLSMGIVMGTAFCAYGLMQESGIAVERSHIERSIRSVTSEKDKLVDYFPYSGTPNDAYGRTGAGAIAMHLLGRQNSDFAQRMKTWLAGDHVTKGGLFFKTHYMPAMKSYGLLGTYLLNPQAHRKVLDYYKWHYILDQGFSGNFYHSNNVTSYMHYYPSKPYAWLAWGHTNWAALGLAQCRMNLRIAGAKTTILGVARERLSKELKEVFDLIDSKKYGLAAKKLSTSKDSRKIHFQSFINRRLKTEKRKIEDLLAIGDIKTAAETIGQCRTQFGKLFNFTAPKSINNPQELKLGKMFYDILQRPLNSSVKKSSKDLRDFAKNYPSSPYAKLALEMMYEKEAAERFPDEWAKILEETARQKAKPRHWRHVTTRYSNFVSNFLEYKVMYHDQPDLRDRIAKMEQYFLTRGTPDHSKFARAFDKNNKERDKKHYYNRYRTSSSFKDIFKMPKLKVLLLPAGRGLQVNELLKLKDKCPDLEELDLESNRINDLSFLMGLDKLGKFSISGLNNKNVDQLVSAKPALTYLSLNSSRSLSSEGFAKLATFKKLEYLELRGSSINGHEFRQFKNIPLKYIGLSRGKIDSQGVKAIGQIATLEELDFSFNYSLNDEDLKNLHGLKNLRFINLIGTSVSRNAVQELIEIISKNRKAELIVDEPIPYKKTIRIIR